MNSVNTKKAIVLVLLLILPILMGARQSDNRRDLWLEYMNQMAQPAMENLAGDRLKERMPVELPEDYDNPEHRREVAYLEAFARTLSGIAPCLNSEGGSEWEQELREVYREWAILATEHSVNPESNDYMIWEGGQPLVDASFFARGLIQSPWLWESLNDKTQQQVVDVFTSNRQNSSGLLQLDLILRHGRCIFCLMRSSIRSCSH